jgi:hypothetical protein
VNRANIWNKLLDQRMLDVLLDISAVIVAKGTPEELQAARAGLTKEHLDAITPEMACVVCNFLDGARTHRESQK